MSGDDLEAVVDCVAAVPALAQYLPVFESGDYVFDAGPHPPVHPVVVVADDPAGVVATRCGDGGDAAVAAVAEDRSVAGEALDGVAGDHDAVAVAGPGQR